MRETEIIQAAKRGVSDAYLLLFERYAAVVYLFLLLRIGCGNSLLALVDEIFCQTFSRLPYRKANFKFARLLYAISFRVSVENIYRRVNPPLVATKLAAFLACVRKLPENYQMPVLVSRIPQLKEQAILFAGVLPEDFSMLEQRGLVALQFPLEELDEITEQLKYPKRAEDFSRQLQNLALATAWELFFVFFSKITGWFCFTAVIAAIFLFVRLPAEKFANFLPLFVGIVVPPVSLGILINFIARLDRRLAQKKWKKANEAGNL